MDEMEDAIGPGSDLAISLTGILMVMLIAAFFWVSSLQLNNSASQDELMRQQLRIESLQKLVDLLQRDEDTVAAQAEALASLQQQLEEMQELMDELSKEVADQDESLVEKDSLLLAQVGEIDLLRTKLFDQTDLLQRIKLDLTAKAKTLKSLQNDNKESKQLAGRLKDEIDAFKSALRDRNTDLNDTIRLLGTKNLEVSGLTARITELNADIRQLRKELSATRSALRSTQHELEIVGKAEQGKMSNLLAQKAEIFRLLRQVNKLENEVEELNNRQPPFINLPEEKGFRFDTGSAQLSPDFEKYVQNTLIPLIDQTANALGATVIEVVGHTDEVRVGGRSKCNFDKELLFVMNQKRDHSVLVSCSNVDLGMARAVSVANALRNSGIGDEYTIRSLSAGQTTLTNEQDRPVARDPLYAIGDASRRRIEIRIRKPVQEVTATRQ